MHLRWSTVSLAINAKSPCGRMTHTQHSARMTLLHKSVFRHPSPAVCAELTQSQALGCCMHPRWPWQVHGTHHTYCFLHLHRKRTHPFRIRSAGVSHSEIWTTSSIYCSHFPRHSCESRSRGFLREDKLLQYHTVRHAGLHDGNLHLVGLM